MKETTYLTCPNRKGGKVKIDICLQNCEFASTCDKFKKVDPSTREDACKRLHISTKHLKEIEPVIEVEAEVVGEVSIENVDNPPSEDFQESPETVELVKVNQQEGEAKTLYDKAMGFRKDLERGFLELGKILSKMFINRFTYGWSTWNEFKSSDPLFEKLEIKGRMIDYLRAISDTFLPWGIPEDDLTEVGKAKLITILPVVDKKNVAAWIKEAKTTSCRELAEKIRKAQGKDKGDEKELGEQTETLIFHVYPPQKETIERALKILESKTGSNKRGHLLEMMAAEVISTYGNNDTE